MKRMGEPVDNTGSSLYSMISDASMPIIIDEGLIKTYPTDVVVDVIARLFHLENENKETNTLQKIAGKEIQFSGKINKSESENGEDIINIFVSNDCNREKLIGKMKKYGWLLSYQYGDKMTFEKKFPLYVYAIQLIYYGHNKLYHMSSEENDESILKKGIKAKNDSISFKDGTERVYLFLNKPDPEIFSGMAAYKSVHKMSLFEIDLTKINNGIKFYFDQRFPDALFTYEPMPSFAIKKIE